MKKNLNNVHSSNEITQKSNIISKFQLKCKKKSIFKFYRIVEPRPRAWIILFKIQQYKIDIFTRLFRHQIDDCLRKYSSQQKINLSSIYLDPKIFFCLSFNTFKSCFVEII